MPAWISANLGTIAVALALSLAVLAAVRSMLRDRKNGTSSCGGSCAHCAGCAACRSAAQGGSHPRANGAPGKAASAALRSNPGQSHTPR